MPLCDTWPFSCWSTHCLLYISDRWWCMGVLSVLYTVHLSRPRYYNRHNYHDGWFRWRVWLHSQWLGRIWFTQISPFWVSQWIFPCGSSRCRYRSRPRAYFLTILVLLPNGQKYRTQAVHVSTSCPPLSPPLFLSLPLFNWLDKKALQQVQPNRGSQKWESVLGRSSWYTCSSAGHVL